MARFLIFLAGLPCFVPMFDISDIFPRSVSYNQRKIKVDARENIKYSKSMIVPAKINHLHQDKDYNCAPTAVAMLLGRSVSECEKICQTKKSGTSDFNVSTALRLLKINHYLVLPRDLDYIAEASNLGKLSCKFPLYVSGTFKDKSRRGRDRVRHHAFIVADGNVYDPSESAPLPVESYAHIFTRSLTLRTLIVIDEERPNFLKNFVD